MKNYIKSMVPWRPFNDNTSNKTTTMSMNHIYNNHGSMGRYCGNCKQGICTAIAREYKHQKCVKINPF